MKVPAVFLLLAIPCYPMVIGNDGAVTFTKAQADMLEQHIRDDKTMIDELQKEVWKLKLLLKVPKQCT